MTTGSGTAPTAPAVAFVGADEAPWVDVPGGQRRLVHADVAGGVWALGVRYEPGSGTERHQHTGEVFGWTISGRWRYVEYGIDYTAGTFVHETAGSAHTLVVPVGTTEVTEVLFVIHGANLMLDEEDRVTRVNDAAAIAARYARLCGEQGHAVPAFVRAALGGGR
jgi:2,4'-dihydroxyacetophenone dioxygenase